MRAPLRRLEEEVRSSLPGEEAAKELDQAFLHRVLEYGGLHGALAVSADEAVTSISYFTTIIIIIVGIVSFTYSNITICRYCYEYYMLSLLHLEEVDDEGRHGVRTRFDYEHLLLP